MENVSQAKALSLPKARKRRRRRKRKSVKFGNCKCQTAVFSCKCCGKIFFCISHLQQEAHKCTTLNLAAEEAQAKAPGDANEQKADLANC